MTIGEIIKISKDLKYLGSILNGNCRIGKDVENTINKTISYLKFSVPKQERRI